MRAQDVRLDDTVIAELRQRAKDLEAYSTLWAGGPEIDSSGSAALSSLVERLANMYPYGDAKYIGQLLKPPHPVAWVAQAITALINPNNHAMDGGPATAVLEKEVVAKLAAMFGYQEHLGHLTSSGTIANLEALWVARELHPGKVILSGTNAHYTHERMCRLLGTPHETIPEDDLGRLSMADLRVRLAQGGVGTVVVTLGTTGLGALDQVHEAADLAAEFGARLHIDAAYGGFHTLLATGPQPLVDPAPFLAIRRADSIVVDPHKHGLQPYGCGSVLFADPSVGKLYSHNSPYTYFTSSDLHLGEISLECSRAGASAAAFWTTVEALGLTREGMGSIIADGRKAALQIADIIRAADGAELVVEPELDIVCAFPRRPTTVQISEATQDTFAAMAQDGWHLALYRVDSKWLARNHPWIVVDSDYTTVLRSCAMKPEHLQLAQEFSHRLIASMAQQASPTS
ncbi:pyridoxal-dependent decarboxylase [Arthrobacter sp. SIMBA_036]|uniref:pyridoxal phosphate-dependent decarboxylase family protein n=1 Tax=Arthrobacter sp. SIMBA_036 TaxID=3085778 RepID=UPI00397C82A7